MTLQTEVPRGPRAALALCLILAIYAYTRILEIEPAAVFGVVPQLAIVALHVVPALAFALVHGALHYRVRGILVFTVISLAVGNFMENLSVATGFPFGHYEFSSLMGPKLLQVPVLLGLAYVGMAYVSWTLARLIVGNPYAPVAGMRVVTLPLVASFIMIAWDLAQDPIWSTVLRGWAWRDGGWFLTVFCDVPAICLLSAPRFLPGSSPASCILVPRAALLRALRNGEPVAGRFTAPQNRRSRSHRI